MRKELSGTLIVGRGCSLVTLGSSARLQRSPLGTNRERGGAMRASHVLRAVMIRDASRRGFCALMTASTTLRSAWGASRAREGCEPAVIPS